MYFQDGEIERALKVVGGQEKRNEIEERRIFP
jgi:hypothetical protein